MDDLEAIAEMIERQNAKFTAEMHVYKHLLTTLIARHAREYESPDEYVMTITAPIVSGFDELKAEGSISDVAFEHAVNVCNEVETHALSLLAVEGGEGN